MPTHCRHVRPDRPPANNAATINLRVIDRRIRVLYVEGYPRWEYRRLALDLLKRADENVEFQCFLLSATPDFPQESSEGLAQRHTRPAWWATL